MGRKKITNKQNILDEVQISLQDLKNKMDRLTINDIWDSEIEPEKIRHVYSHIKFALMAIKK